MAIIQGNTLIVQVAITDTFLSVAYDPETVTFSYQVGNNTIVALTYSGASSPELGAVARTATGAYIVMVDLTNIATPVRWRWDTTSPNGPGSLTGITDIEANAI